ncbi:MAG: tRNA lysidine(34) synthetase TilS [Blautia sp.]|jgi:tRNA(Ile)-lysidine synthase
MKDKIWRYMQKFDMAEPGERLVAGVSGGGDSMALLHVLLALRERGGFSVCAVHVNHGIRGCEADADQELVESFCKEAGIPCKTFFYDVKKIASTNGLGEEEAGRMVRREAFAIAMEEFGASKVALAHHKDDLAETVIHHLARGSSLRGLAGMSPVNESIIRPFLCIDQEEIVHYLKKEQIPYRTDSTNLSDVYTRNKIRHHVLPYLKEQVNEKAVDHIASAAGLAGEADDFLAAQGRLHLHTCLEHTEDGLFLTSAFWGGAHILQLYALAELAGNLTGHKKDLTRQQLEGVLSLWRKPVGKWLPFYGGYYAIRQYDGLCFTSLRPKEREASGEEVFLKVPGETQVPGGSVTCRLFAYRGQDVSQKKYTKWMDYDKIDKNLMFRCRRPGDYITVTKDGGRKKIKDFLINEKVPKEKRGELPLVAAGAEILWAVGVRMGESCKVDARTRTILEITYQGGTWNE